MLRSGKAPSRRSAGYRARGITGMSGGASGKPLSRASQSGAKGCSEFVNSTSLIKVGATSRPLHYSKSARRSSLHSLTTSSVGLAQEDPSSQVRGGLVKKPSATPTDKSPFSAVSARPEVLAYEIALSLIKHPGMWIALLPLMKPTICETVYWGGIDNIMCTWSGMTVTFLTRHSFCSVGVRNTVPRCRRSSPYRTLRRHFGMKTAAGEVTRPLRRTHWASEYRRPSLPTL